MNRPIRHGEVMLVPVDKFVSSVTAKPVSSYIVGHSETGHHHVLESSTKFEVFMDEATKALYIDLPEPGQLVHLKQIDKHRTLPVAPGRYQIVQKTEYDPWNQVISRVFD